MDWPRTPKNKHLCSISYKCDIYIYIEISAYRSIDTDMYTDPDQVSIYTYIYMYVYAYTPLPVSVAWVDILID